MNKEEYYKEELAKLLAIIMIDNDLDNGFIHRDYVKEKLEMSLSGCGIGLHPALEETKNKILKRFS